MKSTHGTNYCPLFVAVYCHVVFVVGTKRMGFEEQSCFSYRTKY